MSKNPELPSNLLWHLLYGKPRRHLFIDVESYCELELSKVGHYRYWDHESAEIDLLSYAFDDEDVQTFDVQRGEVPPAEFFNALVDPMVLKHAYNAGFERNAMKSFYGIYCDPVQWACTMVLGMSLGLPGKLGDQAKVLGMENQKGDGRKAMMFFCKPCKPTKKNGGRTRNFWIHDPHLREEYKRYNADDVRAERGLYTRLSKYNLLPFQWRAWAMDQRINDRGVLVDMQLVDNAIAMSERKKAELIEEAKQLTGLDNPNSVKQLLKWLNDAESEQQKNEQKWLSDDFDRDEIESSKAYHEKLTKQTVKDLLATSDITPVVRRVLEIRQALAKSSVSKFNAMKRAVCRDGRVRGMLQFYGAARTGRWAGRIVQLQNLPQNKLKDLALVREQVRQGHYWWMKFCFGDALLAVLSELIRTAFIPAPGKRFIVVDYSAIEARLIAWDSGEEWRLEVFRTHGMIYEASASQMFGVPLEDCTKKGKRKELRQKGKISELALGYQGGPNALITMGALREGLSEEELLPIVKMWRKASPKVCRLWYDTNDDAMYTVETQQTCGGAHYKFEFEGGTLWQRLPSGRRLAYPGAYIGHDEKHGRDNVTFEGVNQYTHQWGDIRTYGGKLVENRTQANGVDIVTDGMFALEENDIDIVFSVHDEAVVEVDEDWLIAPSEENPKKSQGVVKVEKLMCRPKPGFEGLPLAADGEDMTFYRKGD
jgi:DNA polymerase